MLVCKICHICRHIVDKIRFILINMGMIGIVLLSENETFFMKKTQLVKRLVDVGLKELEALTYLEALALGPTTILRLAKGTGIKRTTLYSIVEALQQKGLVNLEFHGFKKRFVATEPVRIESILNQRRERFQQILPDLEALSTFTGDESSLKYYEGLEAIKGVYEDLVRDIRPHEDYLIVSDLTRWLDQDPEYFLKFIRRRAKLPINIRLLLQDSPIAREHKRVERTFNETIKFLPPHTKLTTNLVITPQRVVVHQMIPPMFAIVIENKSIIQMHREQFEIMWKAIV